MYTSFFNAHKIYPLLVPIHPASESIIKHRLATIRNLEQKVFFKYFQYFIAPYQKKRARESQTKAPPKKEAQRRLDKDSQGELLTKVCHR